MKELFKSSPLFLRFWLASIFSQLGSRIHSLILLWLVYHWSGSAIHVGLVMIATSLPGVLIAPVAGSMIDRHNKIMVMVLSDISRMLLTLFLATLFFTNILDTTWLIVATIGISVASAYFNPASLSVLPTIVKTDYLRQANAMNQITISSSAIAGPLIGITIIATIGVLNAFLVAALFYFISPLLLFGIKDSTPKILKSSRSIFDDMREGWSVIKEYPIVYKMLDKSAVVNFFFASLVIVIPIVSHGEATSIGFMMSSIGAGMLSSSLFLSFKKINFKTLHILLSSFTLMGLAFISISFSTNIYFVMTNLFIIGAMLNIFNITLLTIYQTKLPIEAMGKIMSFMSAISLSLQPISYGVMGIMLEYLGYSTVMIISGSMIIISGYFIYRSKVFNNL